MPEEQAIVARAATGDRRAFEQIYRAYAPTLFSYVLVPMLGDRDDAHDCLRETFLAAYDLVLIDRIERALSAEEAAALEAFVKTSGRGMITLIGYNFDNNNPGPERDRANTALTPFGLAYQGGYFGNAVIPTFDQNHPVSMDIMDVNFAGGIEPVDTGKQGTSVVFATVEGKTGGLAHQTAMMGGRVIVWGDEWLTFDSDWQGYADVQEFWVNMVKWAKPQDFCGVPQ